MRLSPTTSGLIFALIAYGIWGVVPLYFRALRHLPATDIVTHRVIWSLFALGALVVALRQRAAVITALRAARTRWLLIVAAVLIGANWLIYVWAVNNGYVVATGTGYYLNPLANILLGWLVLKERLSRRQWQAVALAAIGVALLAAAALDTLWISLSLCLSFALYGLVKKMAAVAALPGLTIETAVLAPLALAWLTLGPARPMGLLSGQDWLLLALAGLVTASPLLAFAAAAQRIPYATMGMVQFVAPTIQLIIGVGLFKERVHLLHWVAMGFIWAALAIYAATLLGSARRDADEEELELT